MANFYNPYMMQGNYMTELQNMRDRIDGQIQQMQQQQQSMQQPIPQVTQNFQLAPSNMNTNFKLVNNLDDVKKEIVIVDTYFLTKDNTQMWIKNPRGEIRVFVVKEIIPKDEKDLLIEDLQKQIEKLKGGKVNEFNESDGELLCKQSDTRINEQFGEPVTPEESTNVSNISNSKATKRKS